MSRGDRFGAVNDALLPILADRIAKTRHGQIDDELWRAALAIPAARERPSDDESARLNRLVHVAAAAGTRPTERGAVIALPTEHRACFHDHFGISEKDAATKRFRCKNFDPQSDRVRWVLVQCQAACDYAQSNPGSVPFYLGLDFPDEQLSSKKPPDSTWSGPIFAFASQVRRLRVNAGFPLTLPTSVIQRSHSALSPAGTSAERSRVPSSQSRCPTGNDVFWQEMSVEVSKPFPLTGEPGTCVQSTKTSD